MQSKKLVMHLIYNTMNEVIEFIAHNLGLEKSNYKEIWEIIYAK